METPVKKLKTLNKNRILKDNTTKIAVWTKIVAFIILSVIFSLVFKSIELSISDISVEVYLANKEVYIKKWVTVAVITSAIIMILYTLIMELNNIKLKMKIKSGDFTLLKLDVTGIEKDVDYYKNKSYNIKMSEYDIQLLKTQAERDKIHIWDTFYVPVIFKDDHIEKVLQEYSSKEYKPSLYEDAKIDRHTNKLSGEDLQ